MWDFDWSLINENSDTFVLQELCPPLLKELARKQAQEPEVYGRGRWTALMDHLLTRLGRDHGVSRDRLGACLDGIPIFPENETAVREAGAAGAEQRVLSDANEFYVERVLGARGLTAHFSAVTTNAGAFESDGEGGEVLRVRPYCINRHGCGLCPPNLCKGAVIDRWLEETRPRKVIYVGDGSGDFCPATRLRDGDLVCARADYPLAKKLRRNREQVTAERVQTVRARVAEWSDGKDLLQLFRAELPQPAAPSASPKSPK